MLKGKVVSILEVSLYIVLAYWLTDTFFAFNKYSWMLEPNDSICSIPVVSNDNRGLQAAVAAFFLLTPLIIILVRKLYDRRMFEFWLYCLAVATCLFVGWWLFWGRYLYCH
ncbi:MULTISPECIES: DUF2645 family protein [Citrobacter]|uniref:DUF2645 family protein n=1 Tax=Citrobacter TaxID=544 RepID=UPI000907A7D2|nr:MULTISPECIES: DUF2645 family protein [Citrobacter]MDV7072528.1 DUF2645 family protein [Citrobacter werkmanii]TKU39978.1 DUF2645 family protein [Citrobacter sp. wls714]TKU78846.1 DUF2645 family protein [Citrobacter sp. wls706]UCA25518.1 YjeO family protein [Citrobacter werkmanii]